VNVQKVHSLVKNDILSCVKDVTVSDCSCLVAIIGGVLLFKTAVLFSY